MRGRNDVSRAKIRAVPKQTVAFKVSCGRFESGLPFEIDDFQRKAINALENGQNVLVAAPTGAGKPL